MGGRDRNVARQRISVSVWDLLADGSLPRSEWSISPVLAVELAAYLERVRPQRILEVGSGFSTFVLAAFAAEHGAEVVTLEHQQRYGVSTLQGLQRLGLNGFVDLRVGRLQPKVLVDDLHHRWYEAELRGRFDFVFVDGPPKIMGRGGVFFAVKDHLADGWRMWLDDGQRHHEQECLRLWEKKFPGAFDADFLPLEAGGNGVLLLSDARRARLHTVAPLRSGQLGVGVLGNGHPMWWRETERNLGTRLLESSFVAVAARNDAFQWEQPPFVDRYFPAGRVPPAEHVRWMVDELTALPEVRYLLYLDERWAPRTLDERWLSGTLAILDADPDVDQVCLQHRIDAPADRNGEAFLQPFAREPSLLRVDRARELGAAPLRTVQLSPGVFRKTLTGARELGPVTETLAVAHHDPAVLQLDPAT
jgi:Methyltransferase domain